jgi:hypothetical protein
MDKFFYVTDGLNKIGPYTKDEVLRMLFSAHISLTDSILDTRDNMLVPLLQHEDFGGAGNVNATMNKQPIAPNPVAQKIDFSSLRNDLPKTAMELRKERKEKALASGLAPAAPKAAPAAPAPVAEPEPTRVIAPVLGDDATSITQITSTTRVINSNNNLNFFLKLNDKEYGPFKFLVLLSLYKANKIGLDSSIKTDLDKSYRKLSDFLPAELQKSIHVTPIMNTNVVPKNFWKRKNVRLDYEEMVILANDTYSLVAKSIDLSADGIAVVWVYDIPLNEKFKLTLFDPAKNVVQLSGTLTRKEAIPNSDGFPLFKAVFIFDQKLDIKNFIA